MKVKSREINFLSTVNVFVIYILCRWYTFDWKVFLLFLKLLNIVFYKFYRFCRFHRIYFGKTGMSQCIVDIFYLTCTSVCLFYTETYLKGQGHLKVKVKVTQYQFQIKGNQFSVYYKCFVIYVLPGWYTLNWKAFLFFNLVKRGNEHLIQFNKKNLKQTFSVCIHWFLLWSVDGLSPLMEGDIGSILGTPEVRC